MSTHTLIIWLWEETIDEQRQVWRGTVSQVQSGHLVHFQTLEELYRQIAVFVDGGVDVEGDRNRLVCADETLKA